MPLTARARPRTWRTLALALALPALVAACGESPTGPSLTDAPLAPASFSADHHDLQATPPGYIRIGVVPAATEIVLGAASSFTLVDKATGATIFSGASGEATVTLLSAGGVDTRRWLQTACTTNQAYIDEWVARAEALGYEEVMAYWNESGGCYRLLLGTQDQGWSARSAFKAQAVAVGIAPPDAWWPTITIVLGDPTLTVTHDGVEEVVQAPVVLMSADGLVTIDGATYRGVAEVWTNGGGALAGINELPLEQYLYGVVPRELPPVPYGLPEAQKAQAVAARTYAMDHMGKRASDGYDLLPTTSDQVYGGYAAEHPVSTAAVEATAGVVATYQGELIDALYHSTSGGFTANSEDVYADTVPVQYLRGVPDAERGRALEKVPTLEVFMRHANPTNLRAHAEGDFESDWSAYHRWTVSWTAEEMAEILATTVDGGITEVIAVEVTERADHGRVRTIAFVTDAGVFEANKDAIRWTLRYFNSAGTQSSLRSTLFYIEPTTDPSTGEVTGWVAYGGGWGHGVGMSQTGAVGMAKRGRDFQEILRHYYRGVELEQW